MDKISKAKIKEKIKYLSLLIIGILFSNCANQLPPGGGEIDYIPPEIIEVYPKDGTTNFDDEYVELEFSEYVDKRTLKDAIFISPAIEDNIELDWSGKDVRIYFPEELKENTTYVLTIGTDVVDYNNKNRMANAYTITFSTGDEIDRRVITGKIYDDEPEGIMLFAYKNISDTLNPEEDKPDYISQTGKDGSYKLMGLAASTYRIFAIRDEFRDLLFQPDQDEYSCPPKDITLAYEDTLFSNLDFFITKADTAPPRILNAIVTDANHILLKMSEPLDSTYIKSNNFFLYDSTANERGKIKFAYKSVKAREEIVLVTEESFPAGNNVFIVADTVKDIYNNTYLNDYISLTINEQADTTLPNIVKSDPPKNSNDVDFQNPEFTFYFNDAIDSTALKQNIQFTDTSKNKVDFKINFIDDASFKVIPRFDLKPEKEYLIKIDLSKLEDIAGNFQDTLYTYRIKTLSGLEFTGISGKIDNVDFSQNPVLVLEQTKNKKFTYKKYIENNQFEFDRVEAGKYLFWCYLDKDSSGNYTYGYPYPFIPSENFSFYPDTLELRPRWVQTDLIFNFK